MKTVRVKKPILLPFPYNFPHDALKSKRLEKYIKMMLDSIAIGISILSPDMEVIWLNKHFRMSFPDIDFTKRPLCYSAFYSPPRERVCDYCPSLKAFKTGEVHISETDICSNGKIYNLIASPIKDDKGKVINVVETVIDITDRKQMEEALKISEENYRGLFNNTTDAIFIHDHEGRFIDVNPAVIKMYGYSKEELIGQTPVILTDTEKTDPERAKGLIDRAFAGEVVQFEWWGKRKNGEVFPKDVILTKSRYNGHEAVIASARDITDRKRAEILLHQISQDWEDTFNGITDMVTIHDKDFNIIRANKAAMEILRLPCLEDIKVKCFKYYHGRDCPPEGCPSCKCLKTGKPASFELFEPHLNKFIEIRAMPRFDINNQLIGLIHIVRDITERKEIEKEHNNLLNEIKKGKIEWEMTFDNAMEFIVLIDKDFNIRRCNKSFAEYAGLPVKKLINNKCHEYLSPSDPAEFQHFKESVQREESISRMEMLTEKGNWFYIGHQPIRDNKGNYLYTVIIATDITDLKNTQQRLLESEQELKKRIDELEKFYKMAVSRELRIKEIKKELKELRLKTERSEYKDKNQ